MSSSQQAKSGRKLSTADALQKLETKRKAKVSPAPRKQTATQEVKPISKLREWKLLYKPNPLTAADKASPQKGSPTKSNSEEKDPENFKGLCRNCRKLKTCKLPKPEGGVWRCEEYQ